MSKKAEYWVGLLLAGSAIVSPCLAQTAPADRSVIEEVVVTAQKRSETAQRLPASINVVGAEDLARQNVTDVRSLNYIAPGIQLQPERGATRAFIRGVGQGSNADTTEPAVAFYSDEVYIPREATAGSLFDLERVEILPGPQGTLYGRGSAGGAINLIPRRPGESFGGDLAVTIGNYDLIHVSGAADIPLSSDLHTRIAFNTLKRDGYLSNGENDEDSQAARVQALYAPNEALSLLLSGSYYHNGGIGDTYVIKPYVRPSDPWYQALDPRALGYFRDNTTAEIHGKLNYAFGDYTLTYIPAFIRFDNHQKRANAFSNGIVDGFARQYTNELRLAKEGERLRWVVGLFQFHAHSASASATSAPFANPTVFTSIGPVDTTRDSYAVFGQGTFLVTPRARLSLGARVSHDMLDGSGTNLAATGARVAYSAKPDWTNVDWKIGGEFDVTNHNMVYANIQTGYMPGGYSVTPATPTFSNIFDPAKVTAFSVGSKNRFLDNRLQLNLEAYYYDYRDYQISAVVFTGGAISAAFLNAEKAVIKGLDVSMIWSVTDTTQLSVNAALLSPKADTFRIPTSAGLRVFDGYQLPGASETTASATLEQRWPLASGAELSGSIQVYYDSGGWQTYDHAPLTDVGSYTKVDASASYAAPEGRWRLTGWVKNIGDVDNLFTVLAAAPAAQGYISPPRTTV